MLKILCKRGEIAPEEQFLLLYTMFSYLMLDFYVKTRIGFSLQDKRLFEITEVEITRVNCISNVKHISFNYIWDFLEVNCQLISLIFIFIFFFFFFFQNTVFISKWLLYLWFLYFSITFSNCLIFYF